MQIQLQAEYKDGFVMRAPDFAPVMLEKGDFWRVYLDYCESGKNRELAVYSSEQQDPEVVRMEEGVACIYPKLLAEDGSVHDIRLELTVRLDGQGALHFSARIQNNSCVRLNELQYPLFSFEKLAGELGEDILYLPDGLGRRTRDPHSDTQRSHTEYMAADYRNIVKMYKYSGQLSMPWLAYQSGSKTLYLGVHSEKWRQIFHGLLQTEGYRYTTKDIDGNDYREHYMFSNSGTLLKMGNKSFAGGCYGTKEWQEKVLEIEHRHLELGSNGTFFDQLGCCFYLCFDRTHTHGNRIDEDPELRLPVIKKISQSLSEEEWFGTEWVVDRVSPEVDFTHGCGCGVTYSPDAYPYIFRYTFPEIITSNRLLHDEKPGWQKHLNYAFVHGMIFDAAIYRCRASLEKAPSYGEHIKRLVELREKYLDFMTQGRFDLPRQALPCGVWGAEYSLNGESILALWNDTEKDFVMTYGREQGTVIAPGEVRVLKI